MIVLLAGKTWCLVDSKVRSLGNLALVEMRAAQCVLCKVNRTTSMSILQFVERSIGSVNSFAVILFVGFGI